jgi:hypothetical protein
MTVVNEIRISKKTKFVREIGEKEREKVEKKYESITFPISYFGCFETIKEHSKKIDSPILDDITAIRIFPPETEDYDFYTSYFDPFIEEYIRIPLIEKTTTKLGCFKIYQKTFISPFHTFEKIIDKIPVEAFVKEIGAIIIEEDSNDFDINVLNLITTIQPGCINKERVNQTLPAYYFLSKLDENVRDEFKEQIRKCFNNAIKRRKKYYPKKRVTLPGNKHIYSFDEIIQIIEKEVNYLIHTLKGKYVKRFKSDESRELCNEFFDIIADSISLAIKKYE